jgi:hypothetical protein
VEPSLPSAPPHPSLTPCQGESKKQTIIATLLDSKKTATKKSPVKSVAAAAVEPSVKAKAYLMVNQLQQHHQQRLVVRTHQVLRSQQQSLQNQLSNLLLVLSVILKQQ